MEQMCTGVTYITAQHTVHRSSSAVDIDTADIAFHTNLFLDRKLELVCREGNPGNEQNP